MKIKIDRLSKYGICFMLGFFVSSIVIFVHAQEAENPLPIDCNTLEEMISQNNLFLSGDINRCLHDKTEQLEDRIIIIENKTGIIPLPNNTGVIR